MRRSLPLVLAVLLLALVPKMASAQSRPFGLGLVLGEPTGLSAKYYMGEGMALQFALGGYEGWHHDGFVLQADVLWHQAVLTRTSAFTLPFYLGVGGRILEHDWHDDYYEDDDIHVGVRVPFGILMDFNRVPIDVFLELAVIGDFLFIGDDYYDHHHDDFDIWLDLGIGARYYF